MPLSSSLLRIAPASLIVGSLAYLCACSGGDALEVGPTATAERGRIERIVVATGTVEPEREVEVRPRIAGIIEVIHVEAGDAVKPDQPLVELERELLESQVREAAAALRDAQVGRSHAQLSFERIEKLRHDGAASQQKHDDASSAWKQSQARVAMAQARLDTLNTQLSYATVRAPLAGHVLSVPVEEGSAVSPVTSVTGGTLLLSIAGTASLRLEGLVDENEVARVKLGQPARIRTEAFAGRTFDGEVMDIAPLGTRIQNVTYFKLEIEITDPDSGLLRPRMSGDAEIITQVIEDALIVPETALRYRGEQIYVDVVERTSQATIVERDVEIGIVDGTNVQILGGIEAGMEVRLQ